MKGVEGIEGILVVEGIITDDKTVITLSQSINLHNDLWGEGVIPTFIANAEVFVEREDGTLFKADPPTSEWGYLDGRYIIRTGTLNVNYRYRLRIRIDEHEYQSDFTYPIQTPEIDSIFWRKDGLGFPVVIYVSTHDPSSQIFHYRWSFIEDWEIQTTWRSDTSFAFPTQCWASAESVGLIIGSSVRTGGQLTQQLTEIIPTSVKLSELYRITVRQNAISHRAFIYFENIQKNTDLTGSIFAPTPSELRGNIVSTTDPQRPVIGFIDVSTAVQKSFFISQKDSVYEVVRPNCRLYMEDTLVSQLGPDWEEIWVPNVFVFLPWNPERDLFRIFTYRHCVDCRFLGGTTRRPENWPN